MKKKISITLCALMLLILGAVGIGVYAASTTKGDLVQGELSYTPAVQASYLLKGSNFKSALTAQDINIANITSIKFTKNKSDILTGKNVKVFSVGATDINGTTAFDQSADCYDVTAYFLNNQLVVYSPQTIFAPKDCSSFFYQGNYYYTGGSSSEYSALTNLDLSNFDTSNVISMEKMFCGCKNLTSLDVSNFVTDGVTNMYGMFSDCSGLTSLDVTGFDASSVTSMGYMFARCSGLTSLDVTGFDTSKVTSMGGMFSGCSGLTSLDVTGFDTSKVTSMGGMFSGCSKLTTINLSNFDTSQVTSMSSMFSGCSKLTSLDVTNFVTDSVKSMGGMFSGCSKLTSLDVTNFVTTSVTGMADMFYNCSGLTSLDVTNFVTDSVKSMYGMFSGCSGLTSLDVTNFNTGNVTKMGIYGNSWHGMFRNCSKLTTINLSNFDTSQVTDMTEMFSGCSSLTSLDVTNFVTTSVTSMSSMFSCCSKLTTINLSNFDTSQVTSMSSMFSGCSKLTTINLSNFDTSQVTSMSSMFSGCSKLTSLNLSNFDTSKVTSMGYMFSGCSSLTSLDVTNFDTSKVTNMGTNGRYSAYGMFNNCSGLTSLNLSNFDTSKVTSMCYMFSGCSGLTSLDVTNFDTSKVTDMYSMFKGCSGLTSLDVTNFDTSKVTDMYSMFKGCSGLTSLDVSNFDASKVTNMSYMFNGCSGLTTLDLSNFDMTKCTSTYSINDMLTNCNALKTIQTPKNVKCAISLPSGAGTYYNTSDLTKYTNIPVATDSVELKVGYTITADPNSGTLAATDGWTISSTKATKVVLWDSTIGTFPTVTRTGYELNGWFDATSGGTQYTTATQPTANKTIYAQWAQNSFTLTANANGGTLSATDGWAISGSNATKSVDYNTAYGTLPTVTREGYTFDGWFTSATGGTEVTSTTLMGAGATTIYAQWSINSYNYSVTVSMTGTAQTVTITANGTSKTVNSNGGTATFAIPYNTTFTPSVKVTYTSGKYNLSWGGATTSAIVVASDSLLNRASAVTMGTSGASDTVALKQLYIATVTLSQNVGTSATYAVGTTSTPSNTINSSNNIYTYYTFNNTAITMYAKATYTSGAYNLSFGSAAATKVASGTVISTNVTPTYAGANVTLLATQLYTVKAVASGEGTVTPSSETYVVRNGSAAITATPTTSTGYTTVFTSWAKTSGTCNITSTTAASTTVTGVTADSVVTATFTKAANVYKVTLDNQGATTAGTTEYYYQYKTTKTIDGVLCYYYTTRDCTTGLSKGYYITNPTKTGYTFGGYYTGENGAGTQYVNASGMCVNNLYGAVAGDTTLYAKWTINTFTVTVAVNDSTLGSVDATSIANVPYGTSISTSSNTLTINGTKVTATAKTLTGYTVAFGSWSNASGTITAARTITATFTKTANNYNITYTMNGGTNASGNPTSFTYSESTQTKTVSNPTRTGYNFNGWTVSGGSISGTTLTINAKATAVTLTANWAAQSYAITYKDQGNATFSGTHASGYPTAHTYGTATTLKSATKTGYTFGGWFTASDCSGTAITSLGATAYTSAITLYAKWTINTFTVSIAVNDSTLGSVDATSIANVPYGSAITISSNTLTINGTKVTATAKTLTGYTVAFGSWSNASGTITAARTITATFTKTANNYNITYTMNGGTNPSSNPTSFTYSESTQTKTVSNPTRTGYNFNGWTVTGGSISGTTLTINAKATAVTLTANWTAQSYAITYKDQGNATFSGTHATGYPTTHTYGTATTLKSATKTGYTFGGWFTASDCSGTAITSLGATAYTGAITLYAKWTINTFTVSIAVNDSTLGSVDTASIANVPYGSAITVSSNTLTINGTKVTATAKTLTGYTVAFSSWSNASGTITAARTITATFTKTANNYNITYTMNGGTNASGNPTSFTYSESTQTKTVANPTRTGYNFNGWTVSGGSISGTTLTINAKATAVTLTANWTAQSYAITWNGTSNAASLNANLWNYAGSTGYTSSNTGSYSSYTFSTKNATSNVSYMNSLGYYTPIPSKLGYTFNGWYTAASGGTKVAGNDGSLVASVSGYTDASKNWIKTDGATLYAQWSANSYSITYSLGGGTNGTTAPTTYTFGSTTTISVPTRTGYTFSGWSVVSTLTDKKYGTINLSNGYMEYSSSYSSAVYFPLFYQKAGVSYTGKNSDVNGEIRWRQYTTAGAFVGSNSGNSAEDRLTSLWYHGGMNSTSTTISWNGGTSFSLANMTGNLTLTANWTQLTYTVSIAVNDSTLGSVDTASIANVPYGSAITTSSNTLTINGTKVTATAKTLTGYTVAFSSWSNASGTITAARTITANFTKTANNYNITYTMNGGTNPSSNPTTFVYSESTQTKTVANPTRTGYNFNGWTVSGGSISGTTLTINAKATAVTLTANWTAQSYAITYKDQGNATFSGTHATGYPTTHTYGTATTLKSATKTGYTFGGWFTASDCSGTAVTSLGATAYTGAITLYAKWTINTFTVSIAVNDSTLGSVDTTSIANVPYGSAITISSNTITINGTKVTATAKTLTGYTVAFGSWSNASGTITAARTITATFTKTANNYNITYTMNGGTNPSSNPTSFTYSESTQTKTVSNPTRTGYNFNGWTVTGGSISGTTLTINAKATAVTLTANWTAQSYAITYKDQGNATFSGTHATGYPTTHTYGTATTLKSATKTGYTFGGWFTASDCSGTAITSLGATAYTGAITLYAKWTINTFTVSIAVNDSTLGSVDTTSIANVPYGSAITTSSNTLTINGTKVTATAKTLTGYTVAFGSWSNASGTITAARTITATFTKTANNYNITYTMNGGTNASGNPTSFTYSESTQTKTVSNPTRTGYNFNGWTVTGGSISGTTLTINAKATAVTLTANWEIGTYTLILDANDGGLEPTSEESEQWLISYASSDGKIFSRAYEYGTDISELITGIVATKDDHTFLGWYTDSTGGTKIEGTVTMWGRNVRLYAQFSIITYQVTVYTSTDNTSPVSSLEVIRDGATVTITDGVINYGDIIKLPSISEAIGWEIDVTSGNYYGLCRYGVSSTLLNKSISSNKMSCGEGETIYVQNMAITSNCSFVLHPYFENTSKTIKIYCYTNNGSTSFTSFELGWLKDGGFTSYFVLKDNTTTYDYTKWTWDTSDGYVGTITTGLGTTFGVGTLFTSDGVIQDTTGGVIMDPNNGVTTVRLFINKNDGKGEVEITKDTEEFSIKRDANLILRFYTGNSYTLTLNANGGQFANSVIGVDGWNSGDGINLYKNFIEGQSFSAPLPLRTGYTFKGWYTSATDGTSVTTMPSANTTLYAQWEMITYSLYFNTYYSAVDDAATLNKDGYEFTVPATGLFYVTGIYQGRMLPTASLDGYTFLGWRYATSASGVIDFKVGKGFDASKYQDGVELYPEFKESIAAYLASDWATKASIYNRTDIKSILFTKDSSKISGLSNPTSVAVYKNGEDWDGSEVLDILLYKPTSSSVIIYSQRDIYALDCSGMFQNFDNLTSITFDNFKTDFVTSMSSMFASCSNLTSVNMSNFNASKVTNTNQMFGACSGLKVLSIPSNLKSIGSYAFQYCSDLTSITIPSSVTSIGDYAFDYCSGLTGELTIPSNVISIGSFAFEYCSNLTSITIPSSVTSIGDYAFECCSSLASIIIPSSVTSLGDYAFEYCTGLKDVTIGNASVITLTIFEDCISLKNITINSGVVCEELFKDKTSITTIVLGDDVTSVGENAFNGCSGLESLTIENGQV